MTTFRAFTCDDMFRFNNVNLDPLTETVSVHYVHESHLLTISSQYNLPFYMQYLGKWPEYFSLAEDTHGRMMGYSKLPLFFLVFFLALLNQHATVMGKVEGKNESWHGHVTAVTVAPEYRRLAVGKKLMTMLEDISEKVYVHLLLRQIYFNIRCHVTTLGMTPTLWIFLSEYPTMQPQTCIKSSGIPSTGKSWAITLALRMHMACYSPARFLQVGNTNPF